MNDYYHIVCAQWNNKMNNLNNAQFKPSHVNALYYMLDKHMEADFKLHCLTDNLVGFDDNVNLIEIPYYIKKMGLQFPKLYIFSKEFEKISGIENTFIFLDLDTIIVNDLTPLWHNTAKLKVWRNTRGFKKKFFYTIKGKRPPCPYNTSIIMREIGTYNEVWDKFNCYDALSAQHKNGNIFGPMVGVDQSWLYQLYGTTLTTLSVDDGICRFRAYNNNLIDKSNVKIIFFPGKKNPWDKSIIDNYKWVSDKYPLHILDEKL